MADNASAGNGTDFQKLQLVTFVLEGDTFGINVFSLDEIIPMLEISLIPKAPEFLEGIINLRGEIVPIIDLRKQFGCPSEDLTLDSRILISSFRSRKLGFIADGVRNIQEVRKADLHPSVIQSERARFIEGIVELENGQMIQVIAIDRILEDACLDQLSELEIHDTRDADTRT